jgi:putative mRNA 3-end processing factor
MHRLLTSTPEGLYCPPGDFWVDPWQPVQRAVITHAHSDHARQGSARYLTVSDGVDLLRLRLGDDAVIDGLAYGEGVSLNGVHVSLHPSGHMLGACQVQIEHGGERVVVSGDYKTAHDPTCLPFTPPECNVFVSEATFGLPVYQWPATATVMEEITDWWRSNQQAGQTSVLYTYALGKAQRVLAELDPSIGPRFAHGAVLRYLDAYRDAGVRLPDVRYCVAADVRAEAGRALVLAPPSALGSTWQRRLGSVSTAFASGWMLVRGRRRQRNVDRGFVLSDHADWRSLIDSIRATRAEQVFLTHGYTEPLARWLREQGVNAATLDTRYGDEDDAEPNEIARAEGAS